MPQLKKKNPFLLIAIPVFVIFFLIWTVTFNNAFSDPSGGSQTVLTEADFSQDPGITAAPNEDIIAVFLESPSTEGEENDTGGDGFDVIPYRYADALEQTFCWQDSNRSAEHYMTLSDIDGNEIVTVTANGECVTELIEPGDYSMSLFHDENVEKNVAVFIIPEGSKSIINTTTGEAAEDVATFLDTNRCVGCDLSGVNFNNADLGGVDLSDAILNDAILTDANLSEANLSGAELINADLSRANLNGADLSGANLSGAILINADLTNANLLQANLENADTTGADFSGTQTTGVLVAQTETSSGDETKTRVHMGVVGEVTCPDPMTMDDKLPAGSGEDLKVTGPCIVDGTVPDGVYHYRNVNIYDGGSLTFEDKVIDFWAYGIIVEKDGSLIAGTETDPIGKSGGKLTIHLYGEDQGVGGSGVLCKTTMSATVGPCGIPTAIWDTNGASKEMLPGGVEDYFYQYKPLPLDDGDPNAYFGYKVLGVSYGGTLRLFGQKGSTLPDSLTSDNSGKSWVRLAETVGPGSADPTTLKLSRAVDWGVGDRVVVTTTDYLPGHSELLEITDVVSPQEIKIKGIDPFTGMEILGGVQYIHNGTPYSLAKVPTDIVGIKDGKPTIGVIGADGKPAAETRAAVALLSRSIRIVSAGKVFDAANPTCDYDCFPATGTSDGYFGGHTQVRQGVEEFKVQGVEFYQLGQGGRIGHYPAHFHLTRKTPAGTFIKDSSIHDSMTRWITLHGAHGVTLARNVGFMSIGHGFYIEDGTEIDNKFHSNIGILARAAVKNPQNPREVPGILAWDGRQAPFVPYNSDIFNPTVFWIMNGWNDFEYNMAAGATGCGACYWLVPGANSGPSQGMKWGSYASMQSGPVMMEDGETFEVNMDRAGMTPLRTFEGNYCTSAMMSFNTVGETDPCIGVFFFGIAPNPNAPVPAVLPKAEGGKHVPGEKIGAQNKETFYPKVTGGGGRFATRCPDPLMKGEDRDCGPSTILNRCSTGDRSNCMVTVLDKYTSSFHWPQQNFGAIWLRPQWYLYVNSFLSDSQNGGLGFVTGGDYLLASIIPGLWQLATKSVFVGHTQKDNPLASNAGPFNPLTSSDKKVKGLICDTGDANHCRSLKEGISMPLDNFAVNQRLFNIYDGPNYQDSNAFLDIKKTELGDICKPPPPAKPGEPLPSAETNCRQFGPGVGMPAWMYTRIPGIPVDKGTNTCVLPNAAIGWKQPNGFYYPPAFHSANLFFDNVDIRHYVLEPLWKPGTYETIEKDVRENYCSFPAENMFGNFSSVDRQTVVNDDDGSLTGLLSPLTGPAMGETISVNLDPFFNAPIEAIECESFDTAKTSPYEYLSTVVYPGCATNNTCSGKCSNDPGRICTWDGECVLSPTNQGTCSATWGRPCTSADCYGVPLERQLLTSEDVVSDLSTTGIRMAGMDLFQRSMMTLNDATYYIDTAVSEKEQRKSTKSLNVFKGGDTYYVFFLYANEKTKQTYQIYVGDGLKIGDKMNSGDVSIVRANIASFPIKFTPGPTDWESVKWNKSYEDGVLTVTVDMSRFEHEFIATKKDFCKPASFCTLSTSGVCGCSTELTGDEKAACEAGNICREFAGKDVDCPKDGCLGFSFKLPPPPGFVPDDKGNILQTRGGHRPVPGCFPKTDGRGEPSPWDIQFTRAKDVAGSCITTPIDQPKFCFNSDSPTPTPTPTPTPPPVGSPMDTDGDGVGDGIDADGDNDGIPDNMETATNGTSSLTSARLEIPADPDGDGVPNELDLDSDGDGLSDHFEGGGTNDADGDGISDNFTDIDGDGLHDAHDPDQGGDVLPLPDTDGDGVPDFLDSVNDSDDGDDDGDNAKDSGSDSSSSCAIAGHSGVKGGLAGLLVYALIPASVLLRRRLRGRK